MRAFNDLVATQALGLEPEGTPAPRPGYTGRYLVLLQEGAVTEGADALSAAQMNTVSASSFDAGDVPSDEISDLDAVIFDHIGVALVDATPEQLARLRDSTAGPSPILAIEPERICSAFEAVEPSLDYLRGFRDAVRDLAGKLVSGPVDPPPPPPVFDESAVTWGLQAVGADRSDATGRNIRVAVLDTGLFDGHPDLAGRQITKESFITGETADDVVGHGTHCVGTACGPSHAGQGPRYGIASDAEIYMGKVLNNQGRGGDGGILAGIEWAVQNECNVASMSLGAPTSPRDPFSQMFEQAARRALGAGTLVVAAAGNDSHRPQDPHPVSHPANCPSILSVGAIDARFQVASFSNRGININGGEVDIAAPGVLVRSLWPAPLLYRTISGTSMATPHVAGIAALIAETTGARGAELWKHLMEVCRDISLPAEDVGAGLAQAPR
jgi:subtilisin family serine protease